MNAKDERNDTRSRPNAGDGVEPRDVSALASERHFATRASRRSRSRGAKTPVENVVCVVHS